jgi:hypothetical protein
MMWTGDGLLTSAAWVEALLIMACALVLVSQGCFMLFLVRWLSDNWLDDKWRFARCFRSRLDLPLDYHDVNSPSNDSTGALTLGAQHRIKSIQVGEHRIG